MSVALQVQTLRPTKVVIATLEFVRAVRLTIESLIDSHPDVAFDIRIRKGAARGAADQLVSPPDPPFAIGSSNVGTTSSASAGSAEYRIGPGTE